MALWWIESGTLPTLDDARERLRTLRAEGPTQRAFTLKEPYPATPPAPAHDAGPIGVARRAVLAAEAQEIADVPDR